MKQNEPVGKACSLSVAEPVGFQTWVSETTLEHTDTLIHIPSLSLWIQPILRGLKGEALLLRDMESQSP